MNNETLESEEEKEKKALKITNSSGALLSDHFTEVENSHNEILDWKALLRNASNAAETLENLFNNKSNSYLSNSLQQIDISCCGITQVPDVIFSLKYLSVLNLSNNYLEELPKEIGSLCNLLTLKLSGNKLKRLPKSLKNILHLNCLDISDNNLTEVPEVLYYSLRSLTILDLSKNEISKFNDPPGCLNKLVALSLSHNFFEQLPLWVFNTFCQLQYLDISQNQFNLDIKISKYFNTGIYESLQLLNMENCNFSSKSLENFSVFKKLKILHLGNKKVMNEKPKGKNYMGNLKSDAFVNFKEITNLHLQNVQIATWPTDFVQLKNIEVLDLSNNLLSWLSECFCGLTSLKILHLTSNQLLYLPANIGKLVNLREIHLANNKLCQIPESFYSLTNLEYIDLYNNEIGKVDSKIFKEKNLKGIDLGLNYLIFDFCENMMEINECKVLYDGLCNSFRKHFGHTDSRCDLQMTKLNTLVNETGSDSHSCSNQFSTSSFESEQLSDLEDSPQSLAQANPYEDDDWDSLQDEGDELFDPNEVNLFQRPPNQWRSAFQNNYCPANYHAPSVMKTCIRNYKLVSRNDNIEEGQFDSD